MDEGEYFGYSIGDELSTNPLPTTNYSDFYDTIGWKIASPTDPKITADATAAKAKAVAIGDSKLANWLDFVLKYGDQALTSLSKNGVIKNQNLAGAGYTYVDFITGQRIGSTAGIADTTNNAPTANNRVFNIDFTDPKVLIIVFLILLIAGYFLMQSGTKSKK